MLHLVKMGVGALLMISFACPLAMVALNPSLWDEPMVLLVTNLAVSDFALGLSLTAIGLVESLLPLQVSTPCAWAMFASYGVAVALKLMHLLLAVDQFIAIRFPLRYYELMDRMVHLLLAATWIAALLHLAAGMILFNFDVETVAERYDLLTNGTQQMRGCRYETVVPIVYHDTFEVELVVLSFSAAALFIYTAFVGIKQRARICETRAEVSRDLESHSFFANYRAFRKLLRVILLTLLLDGLALVQRRVSLSYPMPQISGLIHQLRLSLIVIEFLVYAMASAKLRAAFKKTLGCFIRDRQEATEEPVQVPGSVNGAGPEAATGLQNDEATPEVGGVGQVAVIMRPIATKAAWDRAGEHPQRHSE